jgi:phage FluMu protein Com
MRNEELVSTKKCPHCQQWSGWRLQPTDRCEHCGQLLDPQGHNRAQQQAAAQQKPAIRLLEIEPEDRGFTRFWKTMVRGGQLLFIALMGFFIWLVTAIAS